MSPICPETGVRLAHGGRIPASDGSRLPRRARARSGLVRQVPAARWAPGPEEARPGMDRARAAAGRLLHEAAGRGLAAHTLDQARRGTLPGMVRTGATFADAAAEYLRYVEHDRGRKPSTLRGYRSAIDAHLLPAFGSMAVEDVTTDGDRALARGLRRLAATRNKLLIQLHGILARAKKVYGLPATPLPRSRSSRSERSGDIEVFSPEEVWALVRAAESEQDAAIYPDRRVHRPAAWASCWRCAGATSTSPARSIRVRASYYRWPADDTEVRQGPRRCRWRPTWRARLRSSAGASNWIGDDDLVFAGEAGGYLDGSALRRRYKARARAAGLRPLRFHDLRHTFGTRMIAKADIRRVQEWMGHADIQTTMRYLHYAPRAEDARSSPRRSRSARVDRHRKARICRQMSEVVPRRPRCRLDRRLAGCRPDAKSPVSTGDEGARGHLGTSCQHASAWSVCLPSWVLLEWGWRPSTRGPSRASLPKRVGRSGGQGSRVSGARSAGRRPDLDGRDADATILASPGGSS